VLQLLEPGQDVGAMVIETNENILAEIGKHAGRGDLEDLLVALGSSGRGVGTVEGTQCGPDVGFQGSETSELTLENERVTGDHRSRSLVSASMT
jgi:hypothetical protein